MATLKYWYWIWRASLTERSRLEAIARIRAYDRARAFREGFADGVPSYLRKAAKPARKPRKKRAAPLPKAA